MKDLLEKYPYATTALREWAVKTLLDSMGDLPDDFKKQEFIKELASDDKILSVFIDSPGSLFDFFDEYDIYIETTVNMNKTFSVKILAGGGMLVDTKEYDRHDAEFESVTMAIKLLEEQLKPKQDAGPDSQSSDTQVSE